MGLGRGMPYLCIPSCSASKRKTTKIHPNKNTWSGGGSSVVWTSGKEMPFVQTHPATFCLPNRTSTCWTSSNSLVFEVKNFEIRVTCVHLVYFALLIKVIFMKCLLYARSLTVYSPPPPRPHACSFLPNFPVSLVPVVYCSLMCCNC